MPSAPRNEVKLLSNDVIHRIAAGEVVDRPASILKELIENSLDAGADKIKVTVVDGGLKAIEVEDNGWGLTRNDLTACVQRHATSKISSLDDLDAIYSLGFRGEALSAAASVSRLVIDTFSKEDGAWTLTVLAGQKDPLKPGTRRLGTKVSVEDLFFNVPARRKFLKRPGSEADECHEVFLSLALARPEISFEIYLVSESGELKKSSCFESQSLADRFHSVYGVRADIVSVDKNGDELSDQGLKSIQIAAYRAPASSPRQKGIRLSINGRAVVDKRLPYSLREAYAGLIEVGDYPYVQVNVTVDPSVIDVNIHPQKKEVRWPAGFSLASQVYNVLRPQFEVKVRPIVQMPINESLFAPMSSPAISESRADEFIASEPSVGHEAIETRQQTPVELRRLAEPRPSSASVRKNVVSPTYRPSDDRDAVPYFKFRELRVIGEAGAAWLLCESEKGLVLIDQHAAHERVNFEKILLRDELIRSKPALFPVILKLPLHVQGQEDILREALEACAFEMADKDLTHSGTLEILAVPESDRKIVWADLIDEIFDEMKDDSLSSEALVMRLKIRVAASLACHYSIRRGQRITNDSIRELLQQMDEVQWGSFCPHGRPLWIELRHEEIENFFHR